MTHSLTLGSLLLTDSMPDADDQFVLNVVADGMSFGKADPVREVILSLLADGDLVRTTRFGNREIQFSVEITGPDLGSVQAGEVALRRELGRGNSLTWQAPDVFAAPTVFDVVDSDMTPSFNDLDELRRKRTFVVTLVCAPFARSANLVTVAALPSDGSAVVINNADTTTGWTATKYSGGGVPSAATVTDIGDGVQASAPDGSLALVVTLAMSSVSMASTRFLLVDADVPTGSGSKLVEYHVTGSSSWSSGIIYLTRALSSTRALYVVDTGTSGVSIDGVRFTNTTYGTASTVTVYDVSRSVSVPQVTKRQQTRFIATGGTERTPASIHVGSTIDIAGLRVGVVHTSPKDDSGYTPPLRRWRITGNGVPVDDTVDTLSLKTEPLKPNAVTCEVPNSALPTDEYVIAVRVKSSVATLVGIDWAVQTFFPTTMDTLEGVVTGSAAWTPVTAGVFEIVPLGALTLPTIQGAGGTTRVSFKCLAADADLFWDEAFLFRMGEDCALTIVEDPPDHLWLDSPDASNPVPRVWEGFDANRADIRHPGSRLKSQGLHMLHPDGTAIFAAAAVDQLDVSATYYRRWHSNAGE